MTARALRTLLLGTMTIAFVTAAYAAPGGHERHHHDHSKSGSKSTAVRLQTICPVTGKPVDERIFADHNGTRIYLANESCRSKFDINPDKYINQMIAAGITPYRVQTQCPVSKEPIDRNIFDDHNGKRIYMCCKKCRSKFRRNPGKFVQALAAEGIILENNNNKDGTKESDSYKEGSGSRHGHSHNGHDH